jgi:predicted protein tyrosine phosphatase
MITFSGIHTVPEYADVYICLADQELHPCFVKRFDPKWEGKTFHVMQFNDDNFDDRYRPVMMQDIENCAEIFKQNADQHVHINCFAGISRSASIAILGVLLTEYKNPVLQDYVNIHNRISEGACRIPSFSTRPNAKICEMIKKYLKLN